MRLDQTLDKAGKNPRQLPTHRAFTTDKALTKTHEGSSSHEILINESREVGSNLQSSECPDLKIGLMVIMELSGPSSHLLRLKRRRPPSLLALRIVHQRRPLLPAYTNAQCLVLYSQR